MTCLEVLKDRTLRLLETLLLSVKPVRDFFGNAREGTTFDEHTETTAATTPSDSSTSYLKYY